MLSLDKKYLFVVPPGLPPCGQKWLQKIVSWKRIEVSFLLQSILTSMTLMKMQTTQPNWHIIKDIFNQIHIINSVYQAFDHYSVLRKWVIKWVPLGSNSEILFFETSNHTQTLQGCKGGSPTTRIGHDTNQNFYHLKNQIKILSLTICHEHCRERGTQVPCSWLLSH